MENLIYLNGEFVTKDQAKVSVFDHGFLYGDGIFEGIRAYDGRVFKLKEHLVRLYESAHTILLDIGISMEEMEEIVCSTLRKNNLTDAYIRLVVSRGVGDLGLDPQKCGKPSIICIADQIKIYPQEMYENGLEVKTVAIRRTNPDSLSPRVKSLNYLNNIMAKIECSQAGVEEAIMLTQEGYVVEGTADNIFILRRGVLLTPPLSAGCLEGITRNAVIDLARKAGIEVREEYFNRHDVYNADECFLTGTAAELIPVIKADGRTIGTGKPGKVFKQLLEDFRELTKVDGTLINK
ncbi:MAG: branched-chain-amino-acid transaminase [Desulfitobacterium sp.]|nr:branched-chain-amino-acid transaminase [Desulfitobacterium sp.]